MVALDIGRAKSVTNAKVVMPEQGSVSSGCPTPGSIPKRPQHRVDARLVARALGLEPGQHVLVDAQRNQFLGGHGLQPAPHDAAHHVLGVELGVVGRGFSLA